MNFSKLGMIPQQLRWWAEKYLEPKFESCSISRAQALGSGEACMVARNEPMHDSVPYLYNNLTSETDILHEYFIPRENIVPFIKNMRNIVTENDINLLNASIRVVNKERGLLTYAPEEAFSVVLFINQEISDKGNAKMKRDTQALIDLSHKYNGRFFLPYQLHYTREQLRTSYPALDTFLAKKKVYDPSELFSSTFYSYLGQK
jgi:FAD/FMN-containing dehydrogenase